MTQGVTRVFCLECANTAYISVPVPCIVYGGRRVDRVSVIWVCMYESGYVYFNYANAQLQFINAVRLERFGLSLRWDSNVGHFRFGLVPVFIIMPNNPFLLNFNYTNLHLF